ncbi:MAG TPA: tRNA (adenosine(37)-N6)-threonylcarbamoyltransferase complex dimerization subunit type 1 TsaB [Chitinophagaceae bacterium]|nr:tRNA (adenosine(37)-N6)-threonylcarbamoyltransferase complex dimerization subunit type 1 TsaB [Chitinophagaceae bacterium]
MAILLHIDTATEFAVVGFSKDGEVLAEQENLEQQQHAAFLQPAIQALSKKLGLPLQQIDAVVVSNGPGSYTGLRVGLASAKGICFALQKPLITLNTLQIMAHAARKAFPKADLFCPMIDARRMEVFTAVYDQSLNEVMPPQAMILEAASFMDRLASKTIVFTGSGQEKFHQICTHPNAQFALLRHAVTDMCPLGEQAFVNQQFADLAYAEPFYSKAFYSAPPKK